MIFMVLFARILHDFGKLLALCYSVFGPMSQCYLLILCWVQARDTEFLWCLEFQWFLPDTEFDASTCALYDHIGITHTILRSHRHHLSSGNPVVSGGHCIPGCFRCTLRIVYSVVGSMLQCSSHILGYRLICNVLGNQWYSPDTVFRDVFVYSVFGPLLQCLFLDAGSTFCTVLGNRFVSAHTAFLCFCGCALRPGQD